jgi:predicted lipoprotein with Yx(FWY)xxD motif
MSNRRFNQLILLTMATLALAGCAKKSETATSSYGAQAAGPLTAKNGMTLYVFDKDKGDQSSCLGKCAVNWPPYVGTGETKPEIWQLVQRSDGIIQWTYDGKPVYFYKEDTAKGDAKGDGKGGVWHVINE